MEFEKGKKVLSNITELFIIAIVIIFPLCVDSTGFFKILECKYRSFLIINSIYIGLMVIVYFYYLLIKQTNLLKGIKLNKIHWCLLAFWGINVVSTFCSPFFRKYNLFVGIGRAEGLISITLYILSFFNITLFGNFKRRYILYFAISSILINMVSILQYIGFNPFNMYKDGIGTHNVSFIGTIGNVDFVSALYCILLTVSMGAYVFLENNKKYEKVIYLLSIYMGFFILEVLDVLSGAVAFAIVFVIVCPFILTDNKRLSRFLIVGALILLGYFTNITINPTYYYYLGKLKLMFQVNHISIMLLVLSIIFVVLSMALKRTEFKITKKDLVIKLMYGTMIAGILGVVTFIYFYKFSDGFLYEIHEVLHGNFDDDFGTYRFFLWKRSLSLVKDYPLIGTGPDTFVVRFMAKYTDDIAKLGELSLNDTAGNNYLTIMVNVGILGIIAYLAFIINLLKFSLKNRNQYSIIFMIAFLCFIIQDFFNLWVVIITPVFWVLMAVLYLSTDKNVIKEMEEKNE